MEVKVWKRSLLFVWSSNELLQICTSAVNLDVRLYLRLPKPFVVFVKWMLYMFTNVKNPMVGDHERQNEVFPPKERMKRIYSTLL